MKDEKVYLVMLCQVYELKGGKTLLSEYPIEIFENESDANREKDKCMAELKRPEHCITGVTREWFKVEYRYVK